MVQASEIKDIETLSVWLERHSGKAELISARAAARVMPVWASLLGRVEDIKHSRSQVLRTLLLAFGHFQERNALWVLGIVGAAMDDSRALQLTDGYTSFAIQSATDAAKGDVANAVSNSALSLSPQDFQSYFFGNELLWEEASNDARQTEMGVDLLQIPLWNGEQLFSHQMAEVRADWSQPDSPYSFWLRWYESLLDPENHSPINPALLREIVLIDDEKWTGENAPEVIAAEIERLERAFPSDVATTTVEPTQLAKALLFDLELHGEQLRVTGTQIGLDGSQPETTERCLQALGEWKDDLQDWCDYASDLRTNQPSRLHLAAQKLVALIDGMADPADFPAGRLVSMGGTLRLWSLDDAERDMVGDTLAKIMDGNLDRLSAILGGCFGHVLARLEPLNDLELGDHEPDDLITGIRSALDRIREADPDELRQLDDEARATLNEMIRELEDIDAAIAGATDPKHIETLKRRFAAKYGGLANVVGRSIERGREYANKGAETFDKAVKWYKRWETLDRIVEWFSNLGGPPGM